MEPLGAHLGALGVSGAVIWAILGTAGRILEPLGAFLESLVEVLGVSWEPFGSILKVFSVILEPFRSLESILEAIRFNFAKSSKTSQNTRFFEVFRGFEGHEIDEKSAWRASWDPF